MNQPYRIPGEQTKKLIAPSFVQISAGRGRIYGLDKNGRVWAYHSADAAWFLLENNTDKYYPESEIG